MEDEYAEDRMDSESGEGEGGASSSVAAPLSDVGNVGKKQAKQGS